MRSRVCCLAAALAALVACEKSYDASVSSELLSPVEDDTPWILKNMIDAFETASGGSATISADFGKTRAHVEMNPEETFAQWVWNAGDSFGMFALSGSSFQKTVFSTTESGTSVDFTTTSSLTFDPPYYAVFPQASKVSVYSGQFLFGAKIPSEQEAVPGGIKDGYTVACAKTQNETDYLHFQNMVSLVRFRMSGDIVSQVKTVTINGTSPVAGDITILVSSDGSASITDDVGFSNDKKSLTATLSGNFVAGKDYYLVLKPGTQSRFQMIFSDGAGHSTTKTAQSFSFPQSRISDFGIIGLGNAFEDEEISYDPIKYMTASSGASKPVTIAVVPDGFTKEEMSTYEMLAKSGIDALMNTEPYKCYSNYFNVWILKAASKESGANVTDGNGNIKTLKDCYFGSKWGENAYNDMTADSDKLFEFVSKTCPDITNGTHTIEEVPVLLIINDTRYGGICHSFSNGQGYGMVPYTDTGGPLNWPYPNVTASTDAPLPTPVTEEVLLANYHNTTDQERSELGASTGDWRNILVHEFGGHCFGRLGDEYWESARLLYQSGPIEGQNWPVPFSLNLASDPSAVTWKADVMDYPLASLVAKDPGYGRVGIFQGGGGSFMYGRWRSEKISCMIDNRFYFSTWQRMLIVRRIMNLSGSTFDAASFWANDVTFDPVRDANTSSVIGSSRLPIRKMPLLPPPVLHEVD